MCSQSSTKLLLATDGLASPLLESGAATPSGRAAYTPYGYRPGGAKGMQSRTGFTGQLLEREMAWYMLGNGHRIYNPVLMRFHSADSLSPFGRGGFNCYCYCQGDPVNHTDPSGRVIKTALTMATGGVNLVAGGTNARIIKSEWSEKSFWRKVYDVSSTSTSMVLASFGLGTDIDAIVSMQNGRMKSGTLQEVGQYATGAAFLLSAAMLAERVHNYWKKSKANNSSGEVIELSEISVDPEGVTVQRHDPLLSTIPLPPPVSSWANSSTDSMNANSAQTASADVRRVGSKETEV